MMNMLRAISFYKIWTGTVLVMYSLHFFLLPGLRLEAQQLFGDWMSSPRFVFYLSWSLLAGAVSIWIGFTLGKHRNQWRRAAYLTIPGLLNPARGLILYHAGLLCFWGDITVLTDPFSLSSVIQGFVLALVLVDGLLLAPMASWILFRAKDHMRRKKGSSCNHLVRPDNFSYF